MRRPVGVVVAGILLGMIALFGILMELAELGIFIFSHSPVIPKLPALRAGMIGFTGLQLAFFIFCAWTVVDLFRLRNWARVAAVAIAGVLAFFSAATGVVILLGRQYAALLPPGPGSGDVAAALVGFATFCFAISAISIWWIIYLNLAGVRGAFSRTQAPAAGAAPTETVGAATMVQPRGTPGWRIVIMIWCWMILLSVITLPMVLWMGTPIFLFGAILRGWAGTATMLALWVVEIYMAIGLLRKWKAAWYVALFFQIYAVGYAATFLLPGVRAHFSAYLREAMERSSQGLAWPAPIMSTSLLTFGLGLGIIVVLVLTWALIQRRDDYLSA